MKRSVWVITDAENSPGQVLAVVKGDMGQEELQEILDAYSDNCEAERYVVLTKNQAVVALNKL